VAFTAYSSIGQQPYDRDYAYDPVGNITVKGSLDDYDYGAGSAGPHAVSSVGDISFGYDANGNRVSRSESGMTVGYSYDAENRLVEVSNSADPDDTSFVYDADGVRVKRVHGDEATCYVGAIEIETDGGDVAETHSIYSLGGGVNAVRVVASPGDDGEVTFTFGDHLGSSSTVWQAGELGDTDPGVRSFQRYYPYGEPRDTYNPNLPTDHTFTGQISDGLLDDGGTGLMYYQARYYDPQVGRFAAADTIVPDVGNPQDLNRYAYVSNNPVNGIDPSGHKFECFGTPGGPGWFAPGQPGYGQATGWSGFFDAMSFCPVVGDVIDGTRVLWELGHGDFKEAAVNAAFFAVPLLGTGAKKGVKRLWRRLFGSSDEAADTLRPLAHSVDDVPTRTQTHHLATNKHNSLYTPQMEEIAGKYGLDLGGEWNLVDLPSPPHLGRHSNPYHEFVLDGMQRAADEAGDDVERFLELFDEYVRQPVVNNPDLVKLAN
jgi:RHS repeat-associated protein